MKVTKRQLRRIIREEKRKLFEQSVWKDPHEEDPFREEERAQQGAGLYVNLTDEQENALNDLEAAMAVCVRAGCSSADVMDTVQGYNLK